jgi:hypothetical protein
MMSIYFCETCLTEKLVKFLANDMIILYGERTLYTQDTLYTEYTTVRSQSKHILRSHFRLI